LSIQPVRHSQYVSKATSSTPAFFMALPNPALMWVIIVAISERRLPGSIVTASLLQMHTTADLSPSGA